MIRLSTTHDFPQRPPRERQGLRIPAQAGGTSAAARPSRKPFGDRSGFRLLRDGRSPMLSLAAAPRHGIARSSGEGGPYARAMDALGRINRRLA